MTRIRAGLVLSGRRVGGAVQARAPEAPATLDLARELRPLLGQLGDDIVAALVELRPVRLDLGLVREKLELVDALTPAEREQLADAVLAAGRASAPPR